MSDSPQIQDAQNAAEARVEEFRAALGPFVVAAESTRMAMIFTDALREGNPLVFVNDSFLKLTGFDRDQILGRNLGFLLGDIIDRETSSAIEDSLAVGIEGAWEMQCRRVDGSEFLAAVYLSPVRDQQELVCQNFLSFVELNGHIDRLLKQKNELHALYEQAPGFIATSETRDHRFTFANASYRKLVGRDDLVGLTVLEALPEIAEQGFTALLDEVFDTGTPFVGTSMPIRFRHHDGNHVPRYINFVYQPVRNAGGRITGLFCEGYDVTAERVASDHLAALQSEFIHVSRVNAMGTMATTLAHEINQPLAAISSYAAGARRLVEEGRHGALEHALRGIEEASNRAGEIIRNLRDFTRRGTTEKTNFDLKVAVAECIALVQAGGAVDVKLDDLTPEGLKMTGDRIQIQQVIINLLRNACHAVAACNKRSVTVNAFKRDGRLVVSVSDTGRGVSAEAAQSIFAWTDSAKKGGMGLGLSISRTIVEAHHGTIWLEDSSRLGSVFCFSVPVTTGRDGDVALFNSHG